MYFNPTLCHGARCCTLDSQINRSDCKSLTPDCRNNIGLRRGDISAQIGATHCRLLAHFDNHLFAREFKSREDSNTHSASISQVACNRSSINSLDTDDSLINELCFKILLAAPITRQCRWVAHNKSCNPILLGFIIVIINSRISNVRRCHHNYLLVIRRISQGLLISGHSSLEYRFTECLTGCSP